jgi:hypothetical protein
MISAPQTSQSNCPANRQQKSPAAWPGFLIFR